LDKQSDEAFVNKLYNAEIDLKNLL